MRGTASSGTGRPPATGAQGAGAAGGSIPPKRPGPKQPLPHRPPALAAAALAALGVVFGDIGTSPLYALKTVFLLDGGAVRADEGDVFGVISLIVWSTTIIVSIKYLGILMRADNDGEGGVMALAALAQRLYKDKAGKAGILLVIGIVGVSLFYGDSIITPAISVLSAVEGLHVTVPAISHLVIPIAAVILVALFAVQRFGTGRVGVLFGPVMVLWFVVLAAAGLGMVVQYPSVLLGLSPTYAIAFVIAHPAISFIALGAVVLVITGAEALYADMGHFGRAPIRRAWFFLVFPALTINYLGQAALVLHHPAAKANPFFLMIPDWGRLPVVVLATAATVIASQAVISGAFSLSRQAVQLGLLPPLTIRQTSEREGGQIYLPAVNMLLFIGVMAVMLAFGSSDRLSTAYGISVTGALVVDTLLLLLVARPLWRWAPWKIVLAAVAFGGLELAFLAGNLSKIINGGWVPLLIAAAVILVMTTWRRGRQLVQLDREKKEGSLTAFVEELRTADLPRVPGIAIFPHPNKDSTPLALRANVKHNHVLHEHVIIVSVSTAPVPHVPPGDAFVYDDLGYADDGIEHLSIRFGFSDEPDIPRALRTACRTGVLPLQPGDFTNASYFISRGAIRTTKHKGMVPWRRSLFVALAHNAANPAARFGLPPLRTVTMGSDVEI
ncbi:potassium transporter Kup [Leifsonia sp. F6_8S_P_1B]|uniref:Probable potassium transport system protein Kup n=1 Tax=Leifsonia williamsii TaxID=3035919 RepID=A0ABT8K9M4_9MICO|nr:potassium transporter Kup [Leifsonia williamsii]MDN4614155.1 potassium transporter Kup [Leifsonia williamsii]